MSFFRGAAVYTLSNVASAAVPFLLLPALTRAMGPEEYGQVAMFATLVTIASAVVGLSVHGSASVRFFDREMKDFSVYVSSCMVVMLASLAGAALLLLGILAIAPELAGVPLPWALGALGVAAASFVLQMRLVIWLVQKCALQYAGLQVSYAVLNAGLTVGMVLTLQGGAAGRMGAQALAMALAALIAIASLARSRMLAGRISFAYMSEAARFGAPLVPHLLGTMVLVTFDRFVIKDKLGLADTGIYMVAVQIALAIALVGDAINKAFVPWLYEQLAQARPEFPRWIVQRTWLCFFAIGVLAMLAMLAVEPLVLLVVGEKYLAATAVLPWLIAGQAFGTAYFLVANYIFYSRRTHYLAFASLTAGVCNAVLTLLLVPRLGMVGAGISFCCAQALLFALVWWCSNRVYPMPWLFWRQTCKGPAA
ncbi:lipopolysaccharide biosynthesis protein [Microvirgula aerodenitrificans]|uniref:lipopolysaccharide biosynthesis protein n=1 Tax=Microvirgula aerodenitrificans TaxID=57480 RepID=UPI00248E2311|nr:oligosaccharide flippase family protein [Microvirgula aerodenitrificans]